MESSTLDHGTIILGERLCKKCKINKSNVNRAWCEKCLTKHQISQIFNFIDDAKYFKIHCDNNANKTSTSVPSTLRHEVWKKYISYTYSNGKCFCCKSSRIEISNFECGHIISKNNGGPITLHNLRPVCGQCNKSMGSKNMDEFIIINGFWIEILKRLSTEFSQTQKQVIDELFYNIPVTNLAYVSKPLPPTPTKIHTAHQSTPIEIQQPTPIEIQQPTKNIKTVVNKKKDKNNYQYNIKQLRILCLFCGIQYNTCTTKDELVENLSCVDSDKIELLIAGNVDNEFIISCQNCYSYYFTNCKTFNEDTYSTTYQRYEPSSCTKCKKCKKMLLNIYLNPFFDGQRTVFATSGKTIKKHA